MGEPGLPAQSCVNPMVFIGNNAVALPTTHPSRLLLAGRPVYPRAQRTRPMSVDTRIPGPPTSGQLATTVVKQLEALATLGEGARPEQTRPLLHELGEATLALLLALAGNLRQLAALDREFESELIGSLLNVPARLAKASEIDLAVRVAEALKFCAPDDMNGEVALAYALAGERERALARVLSNLETATEPFIAEYKAGDVYRELGEADAAEAYYRRSLTLAKTAAERAEATLRITSLMIDSNREVDAAAFVAQQRVASASVEGAPERLRSVGRNDPCPCGSGKKYKKCHGS